jgi:alginate O-acetyltransferase complex protein AlgI
VLFSSPVFIAFFACYLTLHWLTPKHLRICTMIAGSAVFYGYWNWAYAGLPFVLALMTFIATSWTTSAAPENRRWRLRISTLVLLTPLLFFKYTNFIWNDLIGVMSRQAGVVTGGRLLNLGRPLGISFVTFTLIAYLVDVSTGKYPVRSSLRWLLGYVLFFPHLIAGPILRPHELIPQLHRQMPILRQNLLPGLALFTVGLVKKLVFADPIGSVVTAIYDQPVGRGTAEYLFAFYGYSVQIYCDFSGYTDMAIGLALILGVRLPGNFLRPYLAISIADFWRRWHITLSHWLRDYVYIPLGGSRAGDAMTLRNILLTMALGGLWHGANWTFLLWGVLHGVGVAASRFQGRFAGCWLYPPRWIQVILTFHTVALLWIFFRAQDFDSALTMLSGCLFKWSLANASTFLSDHAFELVLTVGFFLLHPWDDGRRIRIAARRFPPPVVCTVVAVAFVLAFSIGSQSSGQFIYFEF